MPVPFQRQRASPQTTWVVPVGPGWRR